MGMRIEKIGRKIRGDRQNRPRHHFALCPCLAFMTKIAIVEANKVIRKSLAEFFQLDPENCCVCTCETAEEALISIPKHEPDIVLMDSQLPNLSGIECTALLKRMMPSIRIIIVIMSEDT